MSVPYDPDSETAAKAAPEADTQAVSRIGMWYASGPADRTFIKGDPAWNVHRVVSDESAPGCVLVENAGGQRFPVPIALIDEVAAR